MNKLEGFLLWSICAIQPVFANESITSNIKYALKRSTDGGYLSVVASLGIVILLIYLTGIIYAKLNVFGHNTMKKQYFDLNDSKLIILSTTPIGNNKSLLVCELAGKKMLLGVTNETITLIKDLDENNVKTASQYENSNSLNEKRPLDKIYPKNNHYSVNEDEESDNVEIKSNNIENNDEQSKYDTEEFGLYKKYLD